VPAVLVGSVLSSSAPDRYVRPVITFVIFASGLKYIGVSTETLGWVLVSTLLAGFVAWLALKRPWENGSAVQPPADGAVAPLTAIAGGEPEPGSAPASLVERSARR